MSAPDIDMGNIDGDTQVKVRFASPLNQHAPESVIRPDLPETVCQNSGFVGLGQNHEITAAYINSNYNTIVPQENSQSFVPTQQSYNANNYSLQPSNPPTTHPPSNTSNIDPQYPLVFQDNAPTQNVPPSQRPAFNLLKVMPRSLTFDSKDDLDTFKF